MSEHQLSYAEAAALYERLEAGAAARRASRQTHRLGSRLAVAAVLVAILVAAVGVRLAGDQGEAKRPGSGSSGDHTLGPGMAPIGSDPFYLGGRRISPERASDLMGLAVPMPDAQLANPGNLTDVWYSPVANGSGSRGEIVLDYVETQIRIEIVPANRILRADPRAAFRAMADEAHMTPGATTINGDPALVSGGSASEPGFAQVIHNGLSVAVMGHRSAGELLSIARALYQD